MRRTCFVALFLAIAGLTGVHLYVMAQGPRSSGFLLVLDHLFEIVLVSSLLALCAAVGKQLLTRCRCDFESPLELLLFSVGIGGGVVATAILILGFFSGFLAVTLTALLICFVIVSRNEILTLPKLVAQSTSEIRERGNLFGLIVLGLAAAFTISRALLPPGDWDSLAYHVQVPTQFLRAGRIYLPDDNLHTAFVQLAHMLYMPLLAYGSIAGPAVLSAFFALLLGLGVFALANRFLGAPTAAFSLALLWANNILLIVGATPRIDVTLAFYLLLAHFALLRAPEDWKHFYISAVLLGFAIGVKQNALIYALGLSPLVVAVAVSKSGRLKDSFPSLFAFGLAALALSLPWFGKNWWLFGAPFYPYFAERLVDPWLTFLYPEQIQPQIVNMYAEMRVPFNIIDLYFNPLALHVGTEAFYYRFSPLFVCLALWLVYYAKNWTLNWLMIPALFHFAVTLLFSPKTNLRYLIPVLAPFTIVAVHVTMNRVIKPLGDKKSVALFSLVSLLVLWPAIKISSVLTIRSTPLPYLAAFTSRAEYVASRPGLGNVVSYVNQHLSAGDRVLMLFEARGFYFEVPVIQDNLFSNWILLARKSSSLNCLAGSGISHVIFNGVTVDYFLQRGLDPQTIQLDDYRQFAEKCLTQIYQSDKFILYRVGK